MSRTTLVLLLVLVAVGCAPTHDSLVRREPGLHRVLRLEGESLPSRTVIANTKGDGSRAVRVVVEEIGRHRSDRLVVLLHGAFSSRTTWRYLAGDLGQDHDLLLVDLPGCGESDRPAGTGLRPGEYAPSILARRVLEATRPLVLGRSERPRVTLVGHSLGAAVALQIVGDPTLRAEFSQVLDQIDGLVLIAPLDLDLTEVDPQFVSLATVDGMFVAFASFFGILDERVARAIRRSADRHDVAFLEDASEKIRILSEWRRRQAAQAILRDAVPFRDGRPDAEALTRLTVNYATVDRPVLIIQGEQDDIIPVERSRALASKLHHASIVELPGARHSPHIGHVLECGELIRLFSLGAWRADPSP